MTLKQQTGLLSTERFEAIYEEQLEALVPEQEDEGALFFDEQEILSLELPSAFPSRKAHKKSRKTEKAI